MAQRINKATDPTTSFRTGPVIAEGRISVVALPGDPSLFSSEQIYLQRTLYADNGSHMATTIHLASRAELDTLISNLQACRRWISKRSTES